MIAVVTSTIYTEAYSQFSGQERYQQTLHTLMQLKARGFNQVFLFDNSISELDLDQLKKDSYAEVQCYHSRQYCFTNKGLNEALLILNHLVHIPENEVIFKISGRYYPTEEFSISKTLTALGDASILGTGTNFYSAKGGFNTRAYLVENKSILQQILVIAVEEMIAYGRDIHGIRSFLQSTLSVLNKRVGTPFQLSLEQSFARILKARRNFVLVDKLNIEGIIAGLTSKEFISE